MRCCFLLLAAVAACGPATRAPVVIAPPPPPAKRAHVLQPFELVVQGAPESGAKRAVLATNGKAWLSLDGAAIDTPGWRPPDGAELTVAETRDDRVRVLRDDYDARVLIWVDRADLAPVIVGEVGFHDTPRGEPGVILEPGARITPGARHGTMVDVAVTAEGLTLAGAVPIGAVGDVWTGAPPAPIEESDTIHDGIAIRVAPDPKAAVLAFTTEWLAVNAVAPAHDGWREIELREDHLTVRGFVPVGALDAGVGDIGGGTGTGWGTSGTIDVTPPPGTCLYDAVDGTAIGILLGIGSHRARRADAPGWYRIFMDSPWGVLEVPAHDTGTAGAPAWVQCADVE